MISLAEVINLKLSPVKQNTKFFDYLCTFSQIPPEKNQLFIAATHTESAWHGFNKIAKMNLDVIS